MHQSFHRSLPSIPLLHHSISLLPVIETLHVVLLNVPDAGLPVRRHLAASGSRRFGLFQDRPTMVATGKAPPGFSAAERATRAKDQAVAARVAGGSAVSDAVHLPIELQPHSYDNIQVKLCRGKDGPWFARSWVIDAPAYVAPPPEEKKKKGKKSKK